MADTAEGAGFWLPSEFLDDFLNDKENKNHTTESDSGFCFPTEFPYELETKNHEYLGFTQKRWVMSSSPQSTLSHMSSNYGSPNDVVSPPMTPSVQKSDAVGDLIHLAAGQVAKIKLNSGYAPGPTKQRVHLGPPRTVEQLHPTAKNLHNIYQHMVKPHKQGCEIMWYREPQMYCETAAGEMGWPVQQNSTRVVGSGARSDLFGGGGAVKRQCAGTGVFLPRRYVKNECNAYSSDSRKRLPGYSVAPAPNRNVHGLHKNFDNMNGFAQPRSHCQPKFSPGLIMEYDLLMARRNALMLQRRRSLLLEGSSPMNRGPYLPQEWTY